jgi:hypothetical protein
MMLLFIGSLAIIGIAAATALLRIQSSRKEKEQLATLQGGEEQEWTDPPSIDKKV